jgi:hypothetical protein
MKTQHVDIPAMIDENIRRIASIHSPYDPLSGFGSDALPRDHFSLPSHKGPISLRLPSDFIASDDFDNLVGLHESTPKLDSENSLAGFHIDFVRQRIKYDFEFWAFIAIRIRGKGEGKDIPFRLNRPQRRLLAVFERLRLNGLPIRVILLKARQWGGSTFIQIYMLWIQLVHRKNWDSIVCGALEEQARNVRAMISKAAAYYPKALNDNFVLKPFEGSPKNKCIPDRQCAVFIGSAEKPDSLRSSDLYMAHLTEVGLWPDTPSKGPGDLIQSIAGSLLDIPYSLLILESTAELGSMPLKVVMVYNTYSWNGSPPNGIPPLSLLTITPISFAPFPAMSFLSGSLALPSKLSPGTGKKP